MVPGVRPPDEDIRVLQNLIRQTVFRLVHGGGPHVQIRFLAEEYGQISVNSLWEQRRHIFIFRLTQIFVPNCHPNHSDAPFAYLLKV